MLFLEGQYNKDCKIFIDTIDEEAIELIQGILNHPISENVPIRIMPDTHLGVGIVIGFTMPLGSSIQPEWVGVDIGCGMLSGRFREEKISSAKKKRKIEMPTVFFSPDHLRLLDEQIRQRIPLGMNIRKERYLFTLPFSRVQEIAEEFVKKYNSKFQTAYTAPQYNEEWLKKKLQQINCSPGKFWNSLGTLGGGNHFIEIGTSEEQGANEFWVTIHTGSRNFGLCIAKHYMNQKHVSTTLHNPEFDAEKEKIIQKCKNEERKHDIGFEIKLLKGIWKNRLSKEYLLKVAEIKGSTNNQEQILANVDALTKDFDKLPGHLDGLICGDDLINYLFDMIFAQKYAEWNREIILEEISHCLKDVFDETDFELGERITSTHNYIDFKDFIIRKGAIASYSGEKVIIPWNMRDGLIIAEGKSNPDWNFSAPHGAGRIYSRSQAKNNITIEDFKRSMEGIYSNSVIQGNIDESPMAYKDSRLIERLIEPSVQLLFKVKPLLNIKDKAQGD